MNSLNPLIGRLGFVTLLVLSPFGAASAAKPAQGPLRIHPENPRCFTDGTKLPDGSLKAVYLTGSHTWASLIDRGPSDPPPDFDFAAYLELLREHHHNFIRLWGRQVSWYHGYGDAELRATPLAWPRTGPGNALDGKPRFDLTKLHQPYFDRLRARVSAARDRGIYVGVMLFGGSYECGGGWSGNPFHVDNNINGIDKDPAFGREWVWKAFCRGHHPILMEHLPPLSFVDRDYPLTLDDPGYTASRRAMGHTRRFAERMSLARMIPRNDAASTQYCLADPGSEYLVYQPRAGRAFTVELIGAQYEYEWFNPATGDAAGTGRIKAAGGAQQFKPPFEGDVVLYLKKAN